MDFFALQRNGNFLMVNVQTLFYHDGNYTRLDWSLEDNGTDEGIVWTTSDLNVANRVLNQSGQERHFGTQFLPRCNYPSNELRIVSLNSNVINSGNVSEAR